MSEDLRNDHSLKPGDDLEAALVKLQPRRSSINRDELLFRAGVAAAKGDADARGLAPSRKRSWLWPAATIVSLAATVLFAVLYQGERHAERPERVVYVPQPRVARSPVERPNPQPAKQPAVARNDAPPNTDSPTVDRLAVESRMMRARHPVLMTDPDNLPIAFDTGGGAQKQLSVSSDARPRRISAADSNATPSVGFPSFFKNLRFGRGGL